MRARTTKQYRDLSKYTQLWLSAKDWHKPRLVFHGGKGVVWIVDRKLASVRALIAAKKGAPGHCPKCGTKFSPPSKYSDEGGYAWCPHCRKYYA